MDVEEARHLVAHGLRQVVRLGTEHAAHAQPPLLGEGAVEQLGIGHQPVARAGMAALDAQQRLAEAMGVALHHHGRQVRLGREVVVDAGLLDADQPRHVVVGEAVVALLLQQPFGGVDDAFGGRAEFGEMLHGQGGRPGSPGLDCDDRRVPTNR